MRFLSTYRMAATRPVPVVIAAAYWLLPVRPLVALLLAGTLLAVVGQGIRIWAAGHIVKDAAIAVTGPFAYTRHPLYLGSTLIGLGLCVASGIWWSFLLVVIVFGLFYIPTARYEEQWLRTTYGDLYERYRAAVPGIGARLSRYRSPEAGPAVDPARTFSWRRMIGNREQYTALAMLLVLAALWAKLAVAGGG
jgi:protein-S-isoprenylcysteine O-methyltransferase Ste14